MAEIYRAKTADAQGRLHLVAVKRVLAHLCEDDEFIQMLIDEARLTAMLKHPNIARVYEFCRTPNEYFISMEYVDGKDLRALLEKARQNQEWLPEEHIAYICMYVARGLHAAHMQTDRDGTPLHIVHRDVSPSNVLVSYGGEVKLCDFGIAKASSSRSQTKTGVIKGKVKYMSPEQAMGRKLDRRSDLFSLGTLLYEMLALQAPFTAGTEIELLFAVRDARRRPIRELRPHLNTDLEIIIERAMAKSRSQRFQSGEEFAGSLQAFLDTYYPNYTVGHLARYIQKTFEREHEREQRVLEEYVISSGRADSVGENLLADVLGPDAEYTQFTAAFPQFGTGAAGAAPSAASYTPGPNPMQQMRVLSSVSMSGIEEMEAMPTKEKQRVLPQEIGLSGGEAAPFLPSAQTMPRGIQSIHADATAIVGGGGGGGEQPTNLLYDDGLHAQETAILSRQQVDALLAARRGLKPQQPQAPAPLSQPPPQQQQQQQQLAPYALADEPELHDASTQILSMNSLPQNIRELLQKKAAGAQGQGPQGPAQGPAQAPAPSPSSLAQHPAMPSLNLQPLESDFHNASTAYLDWSPVEPAPHSELPMPEPSAVHPARALRAPTGAQVPIAPPPRSPTGAQAPIVPPPPPARTTPAAMPPVAPPRPATSPPLVTPRPAMAPSLGPSRPAASPPLATPRPATSPPLSTPPRPLAAEVPAPPALPSPPLPPAPRVASPVPPQPSIAPAVAAVVGPGLADEWEALPHLESTMIARGGQPPERPAPAARPTAAARVIDPGPRVVVDPGPRIVDQGDLQTLPPGDPALLAKAPAPAVAPSAASIEEPVENTLNTEEQNLPGSSGQFDDLPTPVKNVPALRDLGIDSQADFAEDTSKGGLPRGLSPNAHQVDAGQYLSDDDLETID